MSIIALYVSNGITLSGSRLVSFICSVDNTNAKTIFLHFNDK